ncbi:MAG: hypothetical protein G01um101420_580 [Parcubacteria group bacterium Gr01-1014_20]|nr:MAG: hypothetical protein G01um101420_580 [Parcubacteria group bacterium Gr01-1014_20]
MSKRNIIITAVVAILIVILVLSYLAAQKSPAQTDQGEGAGDTPSESLGAEIGDKAQNPVKGELPDTNPVGGANPIDGAYQNPFGQ